MWLFSRSRSELPTPEQALPGRPDPIVRPGRHLVLGTPMAGPHPEGSEVADFALGCFWGAERKFWEAPGVVTTAVGYQGGHSPNPTYDEVCSGRTAHSEAVRVVFDPERTTYAQLLKLFWESHDPTQGMRQGNDSGTQYRSMIFTHSAEQAEAAEATRAAFQAALTSAGHGQITTEIVPAGPFYFAEDYHQQYLARNPNGYCGLGGTGVACPIGVGGVKA